MSIVSSHAGNDLLLILVDLVQMCDLGPSNSVS